MLYKYFKTFLHNWHARFIFDFLLGFWVADKVGKMRELKSGMPQLDPCCFPLLHPRGTPGWKWFLKKNVKGVPTSKEELRMQEKLYDALYTSNDELQQPSINQEKETDEVSEEECDLDADDAEHTDRNELACQDNTVLNFFLHFLLSFLGCCCPI